MSYESRTYDNEHGDPEPMREERLAEIRERAESVRTWKAVWGPPIPQLCDVDIPDLLDEVNRLRGQVQRVRKVRAAWAKSAENARAERDRADAGKRIGGLFAETARVSTYRTIIREIDVALGEVAS